MNEKLKDFISWVPVIQQMIGVDGAICVWDREGKVQAYFDSPRLNMCFEVGFEMPDKSDKLYVAMQTGKVQYNKVPKEVFGVGVQGTITPVFDGGEVVGAITYVVSTDEKESIEENANNLTTSIEQTEEYIEIITKGNQALANNINQVQKITDLVRVQVEQANKVVSEIQKNANYSNILALNASIESARAGQAGKGFAVVSDEMGKFSKLSGEAAKKINKNLAEIVASLNEVKVSVDQSTSVAEEQSEATQKLNKMFEAVTMTANKVTDICKQGMHIEK